MLIMFFDQFFKPFASLFALAIVFPIFGICLHCDHDISVRISTADSIYDFLFRLVHDGKIYMNPPQTLPVVRTPFKFGKLGV